MSAPSTVYSSLTYEDKKDGNNNQVLTYLPLALSEYKVNPSSSSETVQTTDAHFCKLFFCHNVFKVQDHDGNTCVMGLLDPNNHNVTHEGVTGVDYNEMHALNPVLRSGTQIRPGRQGYGRVTIGGTNYIILNDGGLNTKPWAHIQLVDLCAQNLLVFHMMYQNAYYTKTTAAILLIERLQQSEGQWVVTNDRLVSLTELNKARKTSAQNCYIVIKDQMLELDPAVGDKIRITVKMYNEETGTNYREADATPFVSNSLTADVTEKLMILDIWKINTPTQDPLTGIAYTALCKYSYYKVLTQESQDPEQDYPDLLNLFFTSYTLNPATGEVTAYEERAETESYSTEVFMNGFAGTDISGNVMNMFLPEGYYYGFPKDLEDRYPETGTVDDNAKCEYVLKISNTGGRVIGWRNGYVRPIVIPAKVTAMTCSIKVTGEYKSIATLSDNVYTVSINPEITVTGQGYCDMTVTLTRNINNGDDIQDVATINLPMDFGSVGMVRTLPLGLPTMYIEDNVTLEPSVSLDKVEYTVTVSTTTTSDYSTTPPAAPISPVTSTGVTLDVLYDNSQPR